MRGYLSGSGWKDYQATGAVCGIALPPGPWPRVIDFLAERFDTIPRAEIEARSHKPDLLLIDLGLPDEDGVDLIRRVRQWSPVPIVVLSARTMESQKAFSVAISASMRSLTAWSGTSWSTAPTYR